MICLFSIIFIWTLSTALNLVDCKLLKSSLDFYNTAFYWLGSRCHYTSLYGYRANNSNSIQPKQNPLFSWLSCSHLPSQLLLPTLVDDSLGHVGHEGSEWLLTSLSFPVKSLFEIPGVPLEISPMCISFHLFLRWLLCIITLSS